VVNVRQAERFPEDVRMLWPLSFETSANPVRDGPAASALGDAKSADGNAPGVHFTPSSPLSASGENSRRAEVKNPISNEPVGAAESTSPPLLATPGGVRSLHELVPVPREKTSQKVLLGSPRSPIASNAVAAEAVVADALIGRSGR
jgi:hypothetical protein